MSALLIDQNGTELEIIQPKDTYEKNLITTNNIKAVYKNNMLKIVPIMNGEFEGLITLQFLNKIGMVLRTINLKILVKETNQMTAYKEQLDIFLSELLVLHADTANQLSLLQGYKEAALKAGSLLSDMDPEKVAYLLTEITEQKDKLETFKIILERFKEEVPYRESEDDNRIKQLSIEEKLSIATSKHQESEIKLNTVLNFYEQILTAPDRKKEYNNKLSNIPLSQLTKEAGLVNGKPKSNPTKIKSDFKNIKEKKKMVDVPKLAPSPSPKL